MVQERKTRGLNLRLRIMLLVDLVLIVTIALIVAVAIVQVDRVLREQLETEAKSSARLLADGASSSLQMPARVEEILGEQMVVQARIAAHLVAAAERAGMTPAEIKAILTEIVTYSAVDEFWVTDETARAYLTNTGIDFTFSPDPIAQPQASQFYPLLNEERGQVVQKARRREVDDQVFKYVGVSGVDRPRIVQVGYDAGLLEDLEMLYSMQKVADDLASQSGVLAVRVADADLNTLARSPANIPSSLGRLEREVAVEAAERIGTAVRWQPEAVTVAAPLLVEAEEGPRVAGVATLRLSIAGLKEARRGILVSGLLLGLLMCVVGGVASFWLAGRIARPLEEMVQVAQEVADGDLAHDIEVRQPAELGQLEGALGRMTVRLRLAILRIREAAKRIGDTSTNVDGVVGELNRATSQQAAAVSETTAAMEELRSVAEQIAEGSQTVSDAADQTQRDVQAGLQAVSETVARMEEIRAGNEASVGEILALGAKAQRISAVMDLIDDIAAQTKLIAINASIEAATAGEAGQRGEVGRRWGVVAGQVRHLAGNVAQSTGEIRLQVREIRTAINELTIAAEQGTKKIDRGVALSQTTQQTLDQISASAERTATSARQISISTQQQQTAVEQVVAALHDLQDQVGRVAGSSKRADQIVADLGYLAATLNEQVDRFDLGDEAG